MKFLDDKIGIRTKIRVEPISIDLTHHFIDLVFNIYEQFMAFIESDIAEKWPELVDFDQEVHNSQIEQDTVDIIIFLLEI